MIRTKFSLPEFRRIIPNYALGEISAFAPIEQGSVQTLYYFQTAVGEFIFRYYENRSKESVNFEADLLAYLKARNYPCPELVMDDRGQYVGVFQDKPFTIAKFIQGEHIEQPTPAQRHQLIQSSAQLQIAGKKFQSPFTRYRWNYTPQLCLRLANIEHQKILSDQSQRKLSWLRAVVSNLDLPDAHPKGVCHCDFHFSNALFQGDRLVSLIDFDDANITFLTFDVVCLIDAWAWPYPQKTLDLSQARNIIQIYELYRPLSPIERNCLMDVYKLMILFDCIWFFARSSSEQFYERVKIETLDSLGRDAFQRSLFSQ